MLAVALGFSALSTVLFIVAQDAGVLFVARILSGFSVGLMNGTSTAMLTELAPASSRRRASLVAAAVNMGGLGLGPLIAGVFAQYRSQPTVLVFATYLVILVAAGLCVLFLPETVSPRRRPTLRFAGLGLFIPALVLIVASLFEAGMAMFLAGAIVAGAGVGAAFMGSLAIVNRLASPARRSHAISTYFVMSFAGLIIPVVGVGTASGYVGDFPAVLAFSILLGALCLFALARIRGGGSAEARKTTSPDATHRRFS